MAAERTVMCTRPREETGVRYFTVNIQNRTLAYEFTPFLRSSDTKDYALKQIEGTGISMSACREVAVRENPKLVCFESNLYMLFAVNGNL